MTVNQHSFGIPMNATQYADEWQKSSKAFSDSGHYSWMASLLGNASTVLEVGCGSGISTLALSSPGRRILSVDSHASSVSSARSLLIGHNIDAETISLSEAGKMIPWSGSPIKLLTHDILSDKLQDLLQENAFDAIVCWLIGSYPDHIGLTLGIPAGDFNGSEMPRYRELIQKRCYELGQKVLTSSGIVHVVDRGAIRSWSDKDQMRDELAKVQANIAGPGYQVSKVDCMLRKLPDGLTQSKIQYVAHTSAAAASVLVFASSAARRM